MLNFISYPNFLVKTEAKLRFANTSEENAKNKSSEQAIRKKLKIHHEKQILALQVYHVLTSAPQPLVISLILATNKAATVSIKFQMLRSKNLPKKLPVD